MTVIEVFLLGVALAMDAFAVGLTNGMSEPKMRGGKVLLIALFFGVFQGGMPLIGYFGGSAFSLVVEKIAPYLSFALLAFIGGKMFFESLKSEKGKWESLAKKSLVQKNTLSLGVLTAQAIATSIDALAVGVSLLAQETTGGLPFAAPYCTLVIAVVTFLLSTFAVLLGKIAGDKFAEKAEMAGGAILIVIGVKLLADGIF